MSQSNTPQNPFMRRIGGDKQDKSPGFYTPMDIAPGEYAPQNPQEEQEKAVVGPQTVHRYDGTVHVKGHVHDDICKTVMAIRNTTIDGGIEILRPFIATQTQAAAEEARVQGRVEAYREWSQNKDRHKYLLDRYALDLELLKGFSTNPTKHEAQQ